MAELIIGVSLLVLAGMGILEGVIQVDRYYERLRSK